MVFSSIVFLFRFLPVFLILYFLAPKRMRNLVLFFGSLVFYAWGEPVYIILMLFSTLSDYIHGRIIEQKRLEGQKQAAGMWLFSSLAINLAMLGFFKYSGRVSLPIGISFYTFQTMSYTIDVYRGETKAQRNIIAFGAFVSMFPQLIAGPIVQYKTIADALGRRRETMLDAAYGIRRFVIGLAKKVLLANQIGLLWTQLSAVPLQEMTTAGAWLGAVCFAFQIYFDFSGYSDMAVGLGALLGFRFPENFHYPYLSKSITEFWRRWHISLGTWFREYVYIPLGGNRRGIGRQLVNILIVWALTGIWHGASWNFLCWGLWFAFFLILEKMTGFFLRQRKLCIPNVAAAILGHAYTLLVVLIGWVIFAFDSPSQIMGYLAVMGGIAGSGTSNAMVWYELGSQSGLLVLLILGSTPIPARLVRRFLPVPVQSVLESVFLAGLFLLSVAFIVEASYNPFLYFRF